MLSSADAKDLLSYVTKDDPIKMLCHLPCHFMTSEKWTRGKRTTTTTQIHNSHRFRKFNPGFVLLNLSIQSISESCIEIKIFIFTLLCGASKCFMKAFKAFKALKAFEAAQRKVKIKIYLIFSIRPGLGREGLTSKIDLIPFMRVNQVREVLHNVAGFFLIWR